MSGTVTPAGGFTQQQVNDLTQAIADAGITQSVAYSDGSRVQNMPIGEARTLLQMMRDDVRASAAAAGALVPRRSVRAVLGSGY